MSVSDFTAAEGVLSRSHDGIGNISIKVFEPGLPAQRTAEVTGLASSACLELMKELSYIAYILSELCTGEDSAVVNFSDKREQRSYNIEAFG